MRLASVEGQSTDSEHDVLSLAEQARRSLRRDITQGVLEPGQTLRLEFLKGRYGISFSPIREALTSLEGERLVVSSPSKGFKVAPLSEKEMWDAIETRILIDCEALRRSINNGDDAWEVQLVSAFYALKLAAKSSDVGRLEQEAEELLELRHLEFHRSLIANCNSSWLKQLSAQFYVQTERYRLPNLHGANNPYACSKPHKRDVNKEHADLLAATVDRDSNMACALLAKHYRDTGNMIAAAISARETTEKEAS
ncbi:DNA-binding GntR family transcriptional regulator [Variovorax boronicumulans]|uniref:DNA-binding GntR family transcriptional regulator n=2 Tax=Variovorax boronicumulans TaxID=436515 RepID=A0AAW8D4U4_9BURK|nr:GntR family transcriptional regulator [Variovorax boronicumulans]MDP9895038.1 DNA-binding GntR family transcriptional regulator [Variovorax boronicumulans]MDP9993977.1 DNA-binding GntR family transcriptional regulator [Variovorax boronicumulans]MDQ0005160.1 DNA-binding GntR family transcriptional regulator [Variovorax boronicumulans]MDQ0044695.1 DNA-binding GntR family transcriptional regulator [Variovorax boronicumulans]